MKTFTLEDWSGYKKIDIVEFKDFFVLPSEDVAIRRLDFLEYSDSLFAERLFPVFVAVSRVTAEAYKYHGEYQMVRHDTLKTVQNENVKKLVLDRYKDTKFFYDTNLRSMFRPFPVKLSSRNWNIFLLKEKISCRKGISKAETTKYDPQTDCQFLKFLYTPSSESEFQGLHDQAVQFGFNDYSVVAKIVEKLDIVEYYHGE